MHKVYSPNQVAFGTLLGGPIAAVYMLYQNFKALHKIDEAKITLFLGSIINALLMISLPFIPDSLPNSVLPAIGSAIAMSISLHKQLKKNEIQDSPDHTFQSNWRVFLIAIVSVIVFIALGIMVMMVMEQGGWITID